MTVMMMMTRWMMLLRGLVITCVSAFVSGWMHSWGKVVIKSTNISSPILSVLLNGKPASNCMNLVPAVQHISGSQLFKLNQKLALIMNLLLFDLRTERPFEIGKLSFFSKFKTWLTNAIGFLHISHHKKSNIKKKKIIFLQHSFFDLSIWESQPKVAFA